VQEEPDTTNFCGEYTHDFSLPFTNGKEFRDWGDTPVNGRCDSRMGEILLQFLLAYQVISHSDLACQVDFFRQFLASFDIVVQDVDMHILERTNLGGEEVTIGSFYLNFKREGHFSGENVLAQGLYTVRCSESETWVKFTSRTYQFKVHLKGHSPPSATLSHEGRIMEIGPITIDPAQDLTIT
jgi:hypothetical protein